MRTFRLEFGTILLAQLLVGAATCTHGANPAGVGPQAASETLGRFKVADGIGVSLFASEPMVRNPTDMDIDERGRIWITEGVNYRSTFQKWGILQPAGDRIVTLAYGPDGNVNETVFYQDPSINTALGICVLGNRVIVSDSPNVFVLTDTDGDGKADKRELLFTGIGGKDHDHGIHTFLFGPDGKLYFNMGNEGKQLYYPLNKDVPLHGAVEQVPMKPVIDLDGNEVNNHGKPYRMGMVFRCNLDGSEVETLAWNFRNNYEVAVDSFGTLWQSDNDDDGNRGVRINYVMEYGNYGYADESTGEGWPTAWAKAKAKGVPEDSKVFYEWHQYDPGVVPNLLHTGAGSPTGIIFYEGNLLPETFRNRIIHCDALPRVVRAYPTQHDGAGYHAAIQDILTTEDQWFRPVDVCAAPDGSLYIADWNDAGVGGHYMADQNLEAMTGRIYRLAPNGSKPSVPAFNLATAAGCIEALKSPNLSTRFLAWTKLHDMKGRAEARLKKLWKDERSPNLRARALQLLARIPGKEKQYIQSALHDSNPDLRITGLRIARQLKLDLMPMVQALSHDPAPEVRRECAIALRHQTSPEAPGLWAQLALQHDGRDRWYLEALGIGADRQWDSYLDAWLKTVGDHWDTPGGRDIIWRSRSKKTPALLVKIIGDKSLTETDREHYFRSLDFINGPEKDAALIQLLTAK
jgi:putative membrane-bound dehydrogenase-like protein